MPEETTEAVEPKKKRGKLPILIVLVLVLLGGGFFVVKKRSGPKKEPEIKLAKESIPLKEFLVNLSGGQSYLRTEIALGIQEGAKKEDIDKVLDPITDAYVDILSSKRLADVGTPEGKKALRRELAAAANRTLAQFDEKKAPGPAKPDAKEAPKHPDWDSDKGPVLRVYFKSFATQ